MAEIPTAVGTLPRRRLGVDSEHANYKWWTLSCTGLGMLLATINSGTLIIALPDLERALGTSILELVWVILAYMPGPASSKSFALGRSPQTWSLTW